MAVPGGHLKPAWVFTEGSHWCSLLVGGVMVKRMFLLGPEGQMGSGSRVEDQRIISSRHPRASPAANLLFNSAESPSPLTEHRRAGHPVWGEEPGRRTSPLCQVTRCTNCSSYSSAWNSSPSSSLLRSHSCYSSSFNSKNRFFSVPQCPVLISRVPCTGVCTSLTDITVRQHST